MQFFGGNATLQSCSLAEHLLAEPSCASLAPDFAGRLALCFVPRGPIFLLTRRGTVPCSLSKQSSGQKGQLDKDAEGQEELN